MSKSAIASNSVVAFVVVLGLLLGFVGAAKGYSTGDIAGTAEGLNGTYGGQCKVFVNNVVHTVTGITLSGYQQGFANAGAALISDPANAVRGDIIQITPAGSTDSTAESLYDPSNSADELHTAIIRGPRNADGTFNVVDSNWNLDGVVTEHSFNPYTWAAGSIIDIWRFGAPSSQSSQYDFNKDGYADLMTLNNDYPDTDVMMLKNTTGSGGLLAPVNWYHLGGWYWGGLKAVSGDFNGDGYNDLAILTNDGSGGTDVWVLLNTGGSGGLRAPGLWYDIAGVSLSNIDPLSGYFNGGQYEGLVYLRNDGTGVSIWTMSNTTGSLQAPALWYNLPGWGWGSMVPVTGDFNGDGYTDIASLDNDSPSPTIQMSLNTGGTGGLRAPVNWYTLTGWAWSGLKPFVGDFNHDGYADFGTMNNVSGGTTVQMLLNTGGSGGLRSPVQWYNLVGWAWSGLKPFVGDFNHDGYADFGTLNNDGSTTDVMMLLNTGGSGGLRTPANWYPLTGWGWGGLMLPGE